MEKHQDILDFEEDPNQLYSFIKSNSLKKIFLVCRQSALNTYVYKYLKQLVNYDLITLVNFSDFTPNPLYDSVVKGVELFRTSKCDSILAIGGGSAIDVAKCIKLFATLPIDLDYLVQPIIENNIPFIAVPTTAGTGSEATHFAVIYKEGEKKSVDHISSLPNLIIFDYRNLLSVPLEHVKATLLDTLSHAIESYWSVNSTTDSIAYSQKALDLLYTSMDQYIDLFTTNENQNILEYIAKNTDISTTFNVKSILDAPIASGCEVSQFKQEKNNDQCNNQNDECSIYKTQIDLVKNIQLASYYAGKAINIAKTTSAHAMCYKITTLFGIPHGISAFICLVPIINIMQKKLETCRDLRGVEYLKQIYNQICNSFHVADFNELSLNLYDLQNKLQLQVPSCSNDQLDHLVKSVNVDRLKNSPIPLDRDDLKEIYSNVFKRDN